MQINMQLGRLPLDSSTDTWFVCGWLFIPSAVLHNRSLGCQCVVSLKVKNSQLKFSWHYEHEFCLYWLFDHIAILHMPWQLSCHGICKKVIVIALFVLLVIKKNCYIEICVIYTSHVMKLVYSLSRQNHNRPSYSADTKPYGVIKLLIYGAI